MKSTDFQLLACSGLAREGGPARSVQAGVVLGFYYQGSGGTLMTRLLLSRGMSSQLQLSSSCSVPEIGVKSMLSPKSMTCIRFMCQDQVHTGLGALKISL